MQHEIQIPFQGFYHSVHDMAFDRELEQFEDSPQSLIDLFHNTADFQNARFEYAKAYASAFADTYLPNPSKCAFKALESPKE